MLYHLSLWLKNYCSAFNVVHYISFRASAALLTSLLFTLIVGNKFIALASKRFGSKPRPFLGHNAKENIPMIGGLLVIAVAWFTVLLFGNLTQPVLWLFMLTMTLFGAVGLWDDMQKALTGHGISAKLKFVLQVGAGLIVSGIWLWWLHPDTSLWVPFFKDIHPELGIFFIVWVLFVLIGTSNAVNVTDGLDGLATSALIANVLTFSVICYLAGHIKIADYLAIPFVHSAELAVVGGALAGALFGFLWFNTYPAQIFLGDVGSLALGAALGFMALASKQELLLPIAGGIFVIEVLSVLIQVASCKFRGKRVFKMAPLHHHYELLGWPEAKITVRMGIICLVLCICALMMLKIR